MKPLAYRAIYAESASVVSDEKTLTGDGTEADPLTVQWAPMIMHGYDALAFKDNLLYIQTAYLDEHIEYDWDLSYNPFQVYHDEQTLTGYGIPENPLKVVPGLIPFENHSGVNEFLFKNTNVYYSETVEHKYRFFVHVDLPNLLNDYAKTIEGVEFNVIQYILPPKYIDSAGNHIENVFITYVYSQEAGIVSMPILTYDEGTHSWTLSKRTKDPDLDIFIESDDNIFYSWTEGSCEMYWVVTYPYIKTKESKDIVCRRISAENTLALKKSNTPYVNKHLQFRVIQGEEPTKTLYYGIYYGYDESGPSPERDKFDELVEATHVIYTEANFGLHYDIQKLISTWSRSANSEPFSKLRNRASNWQSTRYTSNEGNGCITMNHDIIKVCHEDDSVQSVSLFWRKSADNDFWLEYSQDIAIPAETSNLFQFLYDHNYLRHTYDSSITMEFSARTIDLRDYWSMRIILSEPPQIPYIYWYIVLPHTHPGMDMRVWKEIDGGYQLPIGLFQKQDMGTILESVFNRIDRLSFTYSFQIAQQFPSIEFYAPRDYIDSFIPNDYTDPTHDKNVFDYIEGTGQYTILPKPDSATRLETDLSIKCRYISAENINSSLSSIENIEVAVGDISKKMDESYPLCKLLVPNSEFSTVTAANAVQLIVGNNMKNVLSGNGLSLQETDSTVQVGPNLKNVLNKTGLELQEGGSVVSIGPTETATKMDQFGMTWSNGATLQATQLKFPTSWFNNSSLVFLENEKRMAGFVKHGMYILDPELDKYVVVIYQNLDTRFGQTGFTFVDNNEPEVYTDGVKKIISINNLQGINAHQTNSIFTIDSEIAPTPPAERLHIAALNHGGCYIGQTEFRIEPTATTDNWHPDYVQNYVNINKLNSLSFTDNVKRVNKIFNSADVTSGAALTDDAICTPLAASKLVGGDDILNKGHISSANDTNQLIIGYKNAPTDTNPQTKLSVKSDGVYVLNQGSSEFKIIADIDPFNKDHLVMTNDGNTLMFGYKNTPADTNPQTKLSVKSDGVYVKNQEGTEWMVQKTDLSNILSDIQEIKDYTINHPLPESQIIGPESSVNCGTQAITLAVNSLPIVEAWRGVSINMNQNPNWVFYIEDFGNNTELVRWNRATGEHVIKCQQVNNWAITADTFFTFPEWTLDPGDDPSTPLYYYYYCIETSFWNCEGILVYVFTNLSGDQPADKTITTIGLKTSDPRVNSGDHTILPAYRFSGHIHWTNNNLYPMNYCVFLNSIIYGETGHVYSLTDSSLIGDNTNLGIIYSQTHELPDGTEYGISYILKPDGNFKHVYTPAYDPEPYSFIQCGVFYFGIQLEMSNTYYFTSKGVIYNPNINKRGTLEIRVLWEPTQPDFILQISWFQFYISRVFLVGTNDKCYTWDYLENPYYATTYSPPSGKHFKHVWMNAMNIYCSTTENLLYQLSGNNGWIPIINYQTVKSSISMNEDTIALTGKNATFNAYPLLTRNNFIFEGNTNHSNYTVFGKLVPDNYSGGLFSVRLLLHNGDQLVYSWDITLLYRSINPAYPDQNCEKKIDVFGSEARMNVNGNPYMFYQEDTYEWSGGSYVCIYNSPITLST